MTQRRSIRVGRAAVQPMTRRHHRGRQPDGEKLLFRARVLLRGDTMKEVLQSNAEHGVAEEGRTIGSDPWTIIIYLDEVRTDDPHLWVRPVGMRDALLRISVWGAEGERRCRFVHRLDRGSVISLSQLVQLGGVSLRSGYRVELFRLEHSGPVQVVAQNVSPTGRLV